MGLTLVTPPAVEPLTYDQAKAYLRLDDDAEQATVTDLIVAAREFVEAWCGVQCCTATYELTLDSWFDPYSFRQGSLPTTNRAGWSWAQAWIQGGWAWGWSSYLGGLRFPRAPLRTVEFVKYLDTAGALQTLDSSQYVVDIASAPGRLAPAYGVVYPVTFSQPAAITIRFTAGYGLAAAVPAKIRQAMRLLINLDYEQRMPSKVEMDRLKSLLWLEWTGEYL